MYSVSDRLPPENQASVKALEMAKKNPELLEKVKKEILSIAKKFKCEEEIQPVITAVVDTLSIAEYVKNIISPLNIKLWDGTITPAEMEMLKPGYFTYQDLLAKRKFQELDQSIIEEKMKNVVMVYDINDKSEFVRAYMANGKQLDVNNPDDKKIIDLYDQCFHSWLVNNNMSSQDGVVFNTTKLDKQGKYTERADADKVVNLINNPERGLDAAVKKQGRFLELKVERFQQKPEATITAQADKGT